MGVWIETWRWLNTRHLFGVTPLVGVWIETCIWARVSDRLAVTPLVGVWIETFDDALHLCQLLSHPSWVCGLKLNHI